MTLPYSAQTQDFEPLYSKKWAASYLGVEESTLDVWACTGRYRLPFIKIGRLRKYRKADLDVWIESRRQGAVAIEESNNE